MRCWCARRRATGLVDAVCNILLPPVQENSPALAGSFSVGFTAARLVFKKICCGSAAPLSRAIAFAWIEEEVSTSKGALKIRVAVHAPETESDGCVRHAKPDHAAIDCFNFRLHGFVRAVDVRNPDLFTLRPNSFTKKNGRLAQHSPAAPQYASPPD